MRKRQERTISRQTPKTPSPDILAPKKVRRLPSPPHTRVLRRKGTPTCCNFGKDHQALYPEYFFCHNCAEWETHATVGVKFKASCPAFLPCTANHTSFIFPSTKMSIFHRPQLNRSKKARQLDSSVVSPLHLDINGGTEDVAAESVTIPTSPSSSLLSVELQSCRRQLRQKEDMILDLNRKLTNSKKLQDVYKKKANNSIEVLAVNETANDDKEASELDDAIVKAINEIITSDKHFQRYGRASKAQLIAKAVFRQDLFMVQSLPFVINHAKKWLRNNIFLPWKVLKAMDLAGGSCNYKEIEVLRSLETGGKRYFRGSVLPSTAEIKRAAKKLESKADELVPFQEVQTKWGKSIKFCEARTLRLACDMYEISDKAKTTAVSISESIDAS
jgi:hypothetical protein